MIILKKIFFFFLGQIFILVTTQTISAELIKLDTISELQKHIGKEKRNAIVFSSRYYMNYISLLYDKMGEFYWILPVNEIKDEDMESFRKFLETAESKHKLEVTPEGLLVEEEDFSYNIVPYNEIKKVIVEKPDIILDIEFFFRIYYTTISRINNEKTLEIMRFFRSLEEYNIDFNNIYLVLSKDISLPEWVNEFAYILEKIYPYWENKIFPEAFVLLDEVEKYITFAQYEEAYEILLNIFPVHIENPYFYEKMMIISSRLLIFEDMLKAFEEGYKINSHIINLVPEVVNFLLEKNEYYPAYLLLDKALKVEPWNREIKELFQETIITGYNFYNKLDEDDQLFNFFKEEFNKIKKNR